MAQRILTIIENVRKGGAEIQKQVKDVRMLGTSMRTLTYTAKGQGLVWDDNVKRFRNMRGQFVAYASKSDQMMTGLTRRFQFHYLSILFFGMAIQRTFQGIARSATQTYLKMTEGQTQAGQALLGLSAGFSFLSFTVGEALGRFLEPFIPTILNIIEGLSDWISQNDELVGGLIIAGLAIGSFLMWTGILKLGLMGIQMWAEAAAGAKGIGALSGALGGLGGPAMIAVGALIALAIALAIAQWEDVTNAAKEFGKFLEEDFKGNALAASQHLDNALELMGIALEEFFTIKVPQFFWAGVKATIRIIPQAVSSLLYAWYRAWKIPEPQARAMAESMSGVKFWKKISESIVVPTYTTEQKKIEARRKAVLERIALMGTPTTWEEQISKLTGQGTSIAEKIPPYGVSRTIDSSVNIENLNINVPVGSEDEVAGLSAEAISKVIENSKALKNKMMSVIEEEFGIDVSRYTNTTVG